MDNQTQGSPAKGGILDKAPNLIMGGAFVLVMAIGALQGGHIAKIREYEVFYRWLLSVPTQARLFSSEMTQEPQKWGMDVVNAIPEDTPIEKAAPVIQKALTAPAISDENGGSAPDEVSFDKDRELYSRLVTATDTLLPDSMLTAPTQSAEPEQPLSEDDELPAMQDSTIAESDATRIERALRSEGHEEKFWELAQSEELADIRSDFMKYRREGKLATLGTQFGLREMYADGTLVSLGNLFFGFRKMAANLVWLEVDKYFHSGMIHRMVPMMNTAVALDPNFVDAFLLGAWHLSYNVTAEMESTPESLKTFLPRHEVWVGKKEEYYYLGVDFLRDGIRKNPTNYKLYFDLGYGIYEEKLEDHQNAVTYLKEATHHKHDTWVRSTLYRCLQYNGQYQDAIDGWENYIKTFPDSRRAKEIAPRFITLNTALLFEQEAEAALERAHELEDKAKALRDQAQANPAEAERLNAEAAALDESIAAERKTYADTIEQAVELWKMMTQSTKPSESEETQEKDSFAAARLARIEAKNLIEEKRYYEAIAKLQNARFENDQFFWEASDMIVQTKKLAGIPLDLTEEMAEMRKQEHENLRAEREAIVAQYRKARGKE